MRLLSGHPFRSPLSRFGGGIPGSDRPGRGLTLPRQLGRCTPASRRCRPLAQRPGSVPASWGSLWPSASTGSVSTPASQLRGPAVARHARALHRRVHSELREPLAQLTERKDAP